MIFLDKFYDKLNCLIFIVCYCCLHKCLLFQSENNCLTNVTSYNITASSSEEVAMDSVIAPSSMLTLRGEHLFCRSIQCDSYSKQYYMSGSA